LMPVMIHHALSQGKLLRIYTFFANYRNKRVKTDEVCDVLQCCDPHNTLLGEQYILTHWLMWGVLYIGWWPKNLQLCTTYSFVLLSACKLAWK
jgi:hypothetical protein